MHNNLQKQSQEVSTSFEDDKLDDEYTMTADVTWDSRDATIKLISNFEVIRLWDIWSHVDAAEVYK